MTFMHFGTVSAASALGAEVTLSGGLASSNHIIFARAGFHFFANGTVFSEDRGVLNQVSIETDWIIPVEDAGTDYEIRAHYVSGITLIGQAPTVLDTFQTFSENRIYFSQCGSSGPCGQTIFIVDIRFQDGTHPKNNQVSLFDSAPVMASAEYDLSVFASSP